MEEGLIRKPTLGIRLLLGIFLIPAGIVLRVITQIYLEITQPAMHYWTAFWIVTIGHLALIAISIAAAMAWRRRPLLVMVALRLWMGYGIGAALLLLKDMG